MNYKGIRNIYVHDMSGELHVGSKIVFPYRPSNGTAIIAIILFAWDKCIFCEKYMVGLTKGYFLFSKRVESYNHGYHAVCSECYGKLKILVERRSPTQTEIIEMLNRLKNL